MAAVLGGLGCCSLASCAAPVSVQKSVCLAQDDIINMIVASCKSLLSVICVVLNSMLFYVVCSLQDSTLLQLSRINAIRLGYCTKRLMGTTFSLLDIRREIYARDYGFVFCHSDTQL